MYTVRRRSHNFTHALRGPSRCDVRKAGRGGPVSPASSHDRKPVPGAWHSRLGLRNARWRSRTA
eukprot:359265-Chlamydomonas_euryale.AAC.1